MTKRKTRPEPDQGTAPDPANVGISKLSKRDAEALAKVGQIKDRFFSHLSPGLSEHAKGRCWQRAILFLMRDDYDGQLVFEAWQIGKVMRLLAKSAEIQASWKEIGRIENHIEELMPDMAGLIIELIAFKSLIKEHEDWQAFEELLPDRFLKAVLRGFGPNKPIPPFFAHVDPHDWRKAPPTNFTNLLLTSGD